ERRWPRWRLIGVGCVLAGTAAESEIAAGRELAKDIYEFVIRGRKKRRVSQLSAFVRKPDKLIRDYRVGLNGSDGQRRCRLWGRLRGARQTSGCRRAGQCSDKFTPIQAISPEWKNLLMAAVMLRTSSAG